MTNWIMSSGSYLFLILCFLAINVSFVSPVIDWSNPSDRIYKARSLHRLHALNEFHVRHSSTGEYLPEFHPSRRYHTMSNSEHGYPKGKIVNGIHHPYPESISLTFKAFGAEYVIENMHLMTQLFHDNAKVELKDSTDTAYISEPVPLTSYWSRMSDTNWATVTLKHDGRFHAVIHLNGDVIQLDPVQSIKEEMELDEYHQLHSDAEYGMVVFHHKDIFDLDETHICGAVDAQSPINGTHANVESSKKHLSPLSRRLLSVTPWTNCYAGDSTNHRVSVGVVADAGYYNQFGSQAAAQSQIQSIFATANSIYLQQLHVFLTVTIVTIYTTTGGSTPAWNHAPASVGASCGGSIDQTLNDLSTWRFANKASENSIWHLFTACFPPPGVVGLAWIGVLCNQYYGAGVGSYSYIGWLTNAHEIGHNFGAQHTFQNGVGNTGGIMDYGDGRLPPGTGDYQFNTQYSKDQMCQEMSNVVNTQGITPYCWGDYSASCGNLIVEPGEACDDNSGCCSSTCQLKPTSQCSPSGGCCANCQYSASSTKCNNDQGFCSSGTCQTSICNQYSGLSFCGMKSDNPCRQQCSDGKTCTDAYSTPNLNVPDNTLCSTSPQSVCSNGKCTPTGASAITFSWLTGTWTTCDCSGQQTRNVVCKGSDTSTGPDQSCTGDKPAATQSCTPPNSCVTYAWGDPVWGPCSNDCGGGTQTAPLVCKASGSNVAVSNNLCSGTAPATSQSCNTQSCPVQWQYSDWSTCSKSCGNGVQTRTVKCIQTQNSIQSPVELSACTAADGAQQPLSRACATQSCVTYNWVFGQWSACSATCGGGTQTRPYSCQDSNGNTADSSQCQSVAGQPIAQQNCNNQPCPNYDWNAGAFGDCSLSCGGGIQTRSVQCYDTTNNVPVLSNNCLKTKPDSQQSCGTQACTVYQWAYAPWQPCSKSCGGGTQNRLVVCINPASNIVVDDKLCNESSVSPGTKPVSQQTCNEQSCPNFGWLTGDWSSCSAWCGGGLQTRTVNCVAQGSFTSVSWYNCDTQNVPATARACNTDVQCPLVSNKTWVLAPWTQCTSVCGGGNRTRTIQCMDTNQHILPSSQCNDIPLPASNSNCANVQCPVFWWADTWSSCSAGCAGGVQTRNVECRLVSDPTGAPTNDTLCTGTKPSTSGPCNVFPCPTWFPGPWSECSAACSDGIQTRTLTCVQWDNTTLDASQCGHAQAPSTTRPCTIIPCPHWHRGPWGDCSRPCGVGNQTRDLVCRMPHDGIWQGRKADNPALCPPAGEGDDGDGVVTVGSQTIRPAFFQPCNTNPCPDHFWDSTATEECSVGCGKGTQNVIVKCVNGTDFSEIDESNCLGVKPSTVRACNTQPCPNYQWFALTDWSDCNVFCGNGTQTRSVRCRDNNPNTWVGIQYEIVDDTNCQQFPELSSVRSCSIEDTICQGNIPDEINGKCDHTIGQCTCRQGYGGANCTIAPSVFNVETNAATYSSGVPLNELLQITWKTTGFIPFVSILIYRNTDDWPVAQYVAQHILSTGTYVWQVGSQINDLDYGEGYTVRIWFNEDYYADSALFSIADPCAYVACGDKGICNNGVCECLPGYSGAHCTLGPCDRADCNSAHSACSNDAFITETSTSESLATCQCTDNYSGSQCRTPPGCTTTCQNGADVVNTVVRIDDVASGSNNTDCGQCSCLNRWIGTTCDQCPLQCNQGTANGNCSTCVCTSNSGYFGAACNCRYYQVSLPLTLQIETSFLNDTIAAARFSRTLATDIAIAVGLASHTRVSIRVDSLTATGLNDLTASVWLSYQCVASSFYEVGMDHLELAAQQMDHILRGIRPVAFSHNSGSFYITLRQHQQKQKQPKEKIKHLPKPQQFDVVNSNATVVAQPTTTASTGQQAELIELYNSILELFSNGDSQLYHGVASSRINPQIRVAVNDPTGKDLLAQPAQATDPYTGQVSTIDGTSTSSSSTNHVSTNTIIAIVVGIGGGILLISFIAFLLYYRHQKRGVPGTEMTLEAANLGRFRDSSSSQIQGDVPTAGLQAPPNTPFTPAAPAFSPPPQASPYLQSTQE